MLSDQLRGEPAANSGPTLPGHDGTILRRTSFPQGHAMDPNLLPAMDRIWQESSAENFFLALSRKRERSGQLVARPLAVPPSAIAKDSGGTRRFQCTLRRPDGGLHGCDRHPANGGSCRRGSVELPTTPQQPHECTKGVSACLNPPIVGKHHKL